jgi:hypothetical protein
MDPTITNIGSQILTGIQQQLGAAWARLSGEDQALIATVANDAASLAIIAAGGPANNPAIAAEQKQITAQLANIAAAAEVGVVNTFWTITAQVLQKAVSVATTALIASA